MIKIFTDKEDIWRRIWDETDIREYNKVNPDDALTRTLLRYLPKEGKILEAGCGTGKWVLFLNKTGYQIEGIDNEKTVIRELKGVYKNIAVKIGDVKRLEYSDNSLDAYVSIGVVEHFEEGPVGVLKEAHRALKKDGVIILSVPYSSLIQRLVCKMRKREILKGKIFHQYYFSKGEILNFMKEAGFRDFHVSFYDKFSFIRRRGVVKQIRKKKGSKPVSKSLVKKIFSLAPNFMTAHMILIVGKK
jgi:SAM-dependent methyltransferase